MARYARQIHLPQVGIEGQKKLRDARICVVGAGGLGHPVLQYLTAAGIGTIGIVDGDEVESSNLQRQVLFNTSDIGHTKASRAVQALKKLNPHVVFKVHPVYFEETNALSMIEGYDIIVDATDTFAARYLINDACFERGKIHAFASVSAFEGQISVFCAPNGPCYRCLYPKPPPAGLMPDCASGGVFGVVPGILGLLQANEVIKYLLGLDQSLVGHLLTVNLLTMQFKTFPIERRIDCPLCQRQQSFTTVERDFPDQSCLLSTTNHIASEHIITAEQLRQQKADVCLIDVREPYEHKAGAIEGSICIPFGAIVEQRDKLDTNKSVVLYCQMGQRSNQAVSLLKQHGVAAQHLQGGITAWRALCKSDDSKIN